MKTTNSSHARARHPRPKYTGAHALAFAHLKDPRLWQRERRRGAAIPSQLIVEALSHRPVSAGLAALAGSRGLGFEFFDQLRQRPDADGDIAIAFLEGAFASASLLKGVFLPLGAQDLRFCVSMLRLVPRWRAALDQYTSRDKVTIRSWAMTEHSLVTRLARVSATRKGRFFVALVSLAEHPEEADTLRVVALQVLERFYRYVPESLIKAMPLHLLRRAYPAVSIRPVAEMLVSRPDVLSDRSWVARLVNAQQYPEDLSARLPSLALEAFSGSRAVVEARDLFTQFVHPSMNALSAFAALAVNEPDIRKMLTTSIVVACLSAPQSDETRDWLLQELARLSRKNSVSPQISKQLAQALRAPVLRSSGSGRCA